MERTKKYVAENLHLAVARLDRAESDYFRYEEEVKRAQEALDQKTLFLRQAREAVEAAAADLTELSAMALELGIAIE